MKKIHSDSREYGRRTDKKLLFDSIFPQIVGFVPHDVGNLLCSRNSWFHRMVDFVIVHQAVATSFTNLSLRQYCGIAICASRPQMPKLH